MNGCVYMYVCMCVYVSMCVYICNKECEYNIEYFNNIALQKAYLKCLRHDLLDGAHGQLFYLCV